MNLEKTKLQYPIAGGKTTKDAMTAIVIHGLIAEVERLLANAENANTGETCEWNHEDDKWNDHGVWKTECEGEFIFRDGKIDGKPEDYEIVYCPSCGKRITHQEQP